MQRARRLVAVAAVAVLGLPGLAACARSNPATAAYVGGAQYSVDRVDDIYPDARKKFGAAVRQEAEAAGQTPAPEDLTPSITRQDVVDLLVGIDLGKRVLAEKNIEAPDQAASADVAQLVRLPEDTQYAQLWAEWIDIFQGLERGLKPAELSDAAVMAVYDALVRAGAIQPHLSVAQVREQFGSAEFVGGVSAVSDALRQEADKIGVDVNPRFRPLSVPALVTASGKPVLYSLPYVDSNGPVTDLGSNAA